MLRTLWEGGHQPSWSALHQTTGHPELVGSPGRRAWKGHGALVVTKLPRSVSVLSSVTAMQPAHKLCLMDPKLSPCC